MNQPGSPVRSHQHYLLQSAYFQHQIPQVHKGSKTSLPRHTTNSPTKQSHHTGTKQRGSRQTPQHTAGQALIHRPEGLESSKAGREATAGRGCPHTAGQVRSFSRRTGSREAGRAPRRRGSVSPPLQPLGVPERPAAARGAAEAKGPAAAPPNGSDTRPARRPRARPSCAGVLSLPRFQSSRSHCGPVRGLLEGGSAARPAALTPLPDAMLSCRRRGNGNCRAVRIRVVKQSRAAQTPTSTPRFNLERRDGPPFPVSAACHWLPGRSAPPPAVLWSRPAVGTRWSRFGHAAGALRRRGRPAPASAPPALRAPWHAAARAPLPAGAGGGGFNRC